MGGLQWFPLPQAYGTEKGPVLVEGESGPRSWRVCLMCFVKQFGFRVVWGAVEGSLPCVLGDFHNTFFKRTEMHTE